VRNRSDGSVEIEAEGDAASLDELRRSLAKGPNGARVSGVDDLPNTESSGERPYPFSIQR
jgi:acylphosphatase